MILGHSQDAAPEVLNLCYIVNAHITETTPRGKHSVGEERFSAFCLPGMLPGMYMGYNHHGMVYTINTVSTAKVLKGGTRESEEAIG